MCELKVLGKIDLSSIDISMTKKRVKIVECDECKAVVNNSYGETRIRVEHIQEGVTSFRMYCEHCIDEVFGKHEANTIFD